MADTTHLQDQPHQLYRLHDPKGALLYVGVTVNLHTRLISHKSRQPWWNEVDHHTTEEYPNRQEALDAEYHAVYLELPKHGTLPTRGVDVSHLHTLQDKHHRLEELDQADVALSEDRRATILHAIAAGMDEAEIRAILGGHHGPWISRHISRSQPISPASDWPDRETAADRLSRIATAIKGNEAERRSVYYALEHNPGPDVTTAQDILGDLRNAAIDAYADLLQRNMGDDRRAHAVLAALWMMDRPGQARPEGLDARWTQGIRAEAKART